VSRLAVPQLVLAGSQLLRSHRRDLGEHWRVVQTSVRFVCVAGGIMLLHAPRGLLLMWCCFLILPTVRNPAVDNN